MNQKYISFDNKIKSTFQKIVSAIFLMDTKIKINKTKKNSKDKNLLIKRATKQIVYLLKTSLKQFTKNLFLVSKLPSEIIKRISRTFIRFFNFFHTKKLKQIFLLIIFSLALSITVVIYLFFKSLPPVLNLTHRKILMTTKILDRKRRLLYKIYKDQNRSLIKLQELPEYVSKATIAIEDKDFYHHFGISLTGILRALRENQKERSTVQGGSTITQQLVKNTLLSQERTLDRKIKEAVLAIMVERKFSKNQILEMYLNEVGYGGSSYGIEEASQMYFGIPAKKLTLGEAAFLAGLPASPTDYSPFGSNPEISKIRQLEVLKAMQAQNYITENQANRAKAEKLKFIKQRIEIKAPHFVFFIKQELEKKYGVEYVNQGGLTIQTTLDLDIQNMAQKEVAIGVETQKYLLVGNGAAVVENPQNGEILAMVGSRDYFDTEHDGNVNVATANRQPGSSIKPVTYALALSSGLYSPSTIIDDSPITYRIEGADSYSPINYDNKFHGRVTFKTALASSYNVPAVKILASMGVSRLIDFAENLGITTWKDRSRFGYSLTLGGGEVKLTEMAKVFSVFANQGKKVDQKYILKIEDPNGKVIEDNKDNKTTQMVSPIVTYQISDILSDNDARSPTFGPSSALVIPGHTVSVKTGTTDSKKDNWTIGYTKDYVVAVWIGNNDSTPMSIYLESGNTGAAAIWNPIMINLLKNKKDEPLAAPKDLIQVDICAQTGTLPCPGCTIQKEYFVRGTEPKDKCTEWKPTPEPTKNP